MTSRSTFVIRLRDQPHLYVHFNSTMKAYVVGEGIVGACGWNKLTTAINFVKAELPQTARFIIEERNVVETKAIYKTNSDGTDSLVI